jgi:hypothetical protein
VLKLFSSAKVLFYGHFRPAANITRISAAPRVSKRHRLAGGRSTAQTDAIQQPLQSASA